jgi:hypothetical protein
VNPDLLLITWISTSAFYLLKKNERQMNRSSVYAAGFLALGFGMISFIMLFVEPGMGFSGPADYFDPEKVAKGYTSLVWQIGDLFYLAILVATSLIAKPSTDPYLRWSALAAGVLFLLVSAIDRVAAGLPFLMSGPELARDGLIALLPIRFAVLKSAALSLGFFAWRTTKINARNGAWQKAWNAMGYLVLTLSIFFVYIFLPLPLVFFVWAAWLTVREASGIKRDAGPS